MSSDPLPPWLRRLPPRGWVRAGLKEMGRCEAAYGNRDNVAAIALARRAAGMALNGMLATGRYPLEPWGRTYVEHLEALKDDESAHPEVRGAAERLLVEEAPGKGLLQIGTSRRNQEVVEGAKTIMAHAYRLVLHAESAANQGTQDPQAGQDRQQAGEEDR